jgi:hypothetical protein
MASWILETLMKIIGYVLSYLGLAYVIAGLGILMVSTVSLVAVPLRPPTSSPAPALFPLLVHPGDYQTSRGRSQGVKECTLWLRDRLH